MSDLSSRTVIAVGALVSGIACGAPPPPPPATSAAPATPAATATAAATATPTAPTAAPSSKQAKYEAEQLQRLQALQVFTVPQLIAGQPEESFSCYGPCSRLGKFVVAADLAVQRPAPSGSCEPATIKANLAAVEALKVIHVDGLLPGPSADTCMRAGKLANIAADTKSL